MTDTTYTILDGLGALKTLPAVLVETPDPATIWPVNVASGMFGSQPLKTRVDSLGNQQVLAVLPPSGQTAVEGNLVATGQSASFTPITGRPFNITVSSTFSGSIQLERSFDSGSTWHPLTGGGYPIYVWTAAASESATESEDSVLYRLNCTALASGDIDYRISQ